ncbi:MAG: transposase [Planctomycetota bacterium]
MTRTRYRIFETDCPYFMTCTINGWLPIFTRPEAAQIIFDSWRYLEEERDFRLSAYVILEDHLHLIASAPELSDVIKRFKSFTARQIVDLLRKHGAETLLRQLRALKLRHKTESQFQVWQEGSKPKQIQNDEMMWQKIEYIDMNPVGREYVDDPREWPWSSARNYAGQEGIIPVVTNWQ